MAFADKKWLYDESEYRLFYRALLQKRYSDYMMSGISHMMNNDYIMNVKKAYVFCHTCVYDRSSIWRSHDSIMNVKKAYVFISSIWFYHGCEGGIVLCQTSGYDTSPIWDMNESCHARRVMSHLTIVNKSCHTCEWVMSHVRMSHGTHVNESWHTCEWVMAHMWMSHGTHVNESCHTCERVMAHMWMSHVTHDE